MRLWTIQHIEVIEILDNKGIFFCDISKSDYCDEKEFIKGYEWMVSMMDEHRILRPEMEVKFPIWAWHTRNRKYKRPDLRCRGLGIRGEQMVCIELEIPDSQVLLSDFHLWHFVLNNTWIDNSKCEKEWEERYEWYERQSEELQLQLKRESWKRIFDLEPICTEWYEIGRDIQAVFWCLKKEMITKTFYFVAR